MKMPAIGADGSGPRTFSEKMMSYTPVFLTVLATILAGMSSSEMTQSQYFRALAAQNQSRAGDQWNFYQAKKLRGSEVENTMDLVRSLGATAGGEVSAVQDAAVKWQKSADQAAGLGQGVLDAAAADHASADMQRLAQAAQESVVENQKLAAQVQAALADEQVISALRGTPAAHAAGQAAAMDPAVAEAVAAIDAGVGDDQIAPLIAKVEDQEITTALRAAEDRAREFAQAAKPVTAALATLKSALERASASGVADQLAALRQEAETEDKPLPMQPWSDAVEHAQEAQSDAYHQFTAARLRYEAVRYAAEAQYNMATAQIYEVQVRKSGVVSDRHRTRSKHFFYGMLGAQAGVTIATFALALKRKSALWTVAALIGAASLGMGGYAYLYI